MIQMLKNLRKNLGYGRAELSEIIKTAENLRAELKETRLENTRLINRIELKRLEIEELRAADWLKAREITTLRGELCDYRRRKR